MDIGSVLLLLLFIALVWLAIYGITKYISMPAAGVNTLIVVGIIISIYVVARFFNIDGGNFRID